MRTKLLLAAVLVLGVFANTGCKKEYITRVENNTLTGTTTIKSFAAGDWKLNATTNTYTLTISVPSLVDYSESDGVSAYIAFGDDSPWEALPNVVDGYSIFYYYSSGSVTLETQGYDGGQANPPTGGYVKVVTVPSTIAD